MAAVPQKNAPTAFRNTANAYAQTALPASRPQKTPAERTSRAPAPASASRQREQTYRMFLMVIAAGIAVLCGVAYLWGQASLTNEGYRHSKIQKMLLQERATEQIWRHEQAALSTQAIIERKAQEQGMIKVSTSEAITPGVLTPASATNTQRGRR
jgi:hypothetical protein